MATGDNPDQTVSPAPAGLRSSEDFWAMACGFLVLAIAFLLVWTARPADLAAKIEAGEAFKVPNPAAAWLSKPGAWKMNPLESLSKPETAKAPASSLIPGIAGAFVCLGVLCTVAMQLRRGEGWAFLKGYPLVFLLALVAYGLAGQSVIKAYNLEYALWALIVGLVVCNTVGTPVFVKPAALTEFFIKTGLILLGAEVLLSRLLALGAPGVLVSWTVTPIVLITTFIFGQKILKMESPALNMVISADMSVCGVSAAIATAAACKAKKEELSLAIGLSLAFTVIMMVVMPAFIKAVGMNEVLAGAWLGGTIDSTGAVAAAGAVVGPRALEVAATVKMIQNILIGFVAFGVAVYWVTCVERNPSEKRPSVSEIWRRFPRFVLGFVFASAVFSLLNAAVAGGPELVDAMIDGSTKTLREWLFCLAFVSIGLETNFKELAPYLRGGKPLTLYVCGQMLNLALSLLMSWLMFNVVFAGSPS
ncbi:MAG: putative sulfate exporter family transporter [Planctomycetes bacterium]|nr:putative sulfate exporter family transporter [Planctomycetota bacterium]